MVELYKLTEEAKKFPVSRIGNSINPKLLILLENSNSDPINLKLNPEYTIWRDKKFENYNRVSHSHLKLSVFIEYDKWWHNLWNYCREHYPKTLLVDDILVLEYYPYFTYDDNDKRKRVYNKTKNDWDQFAKESLEINKHLLKSAMKLKIPIFIYYKSGWLDITDTNDSKIILNKTNDYINFYDFEKAGNSHPNYRGSKKSKLISFITNDKIVNRIEYLRKNDNYDLNQ